MGLALQQGTYWIVLIAIGVFIGLFAYDRYQTYQAMQVIEQWNQETQQLLDQQNAQAAEQQRQLKQQQQAKRDFNQDTLCAINSDTDKCVCIHRQTGQYVTMSEADCKQRAKKATDRL